MQNNEKKEWLDRYHEIECYIKELNKEKVTWFDLLKSLGVNMGKKDDADDNDSIIYPINNQSRTIDNIVKLEFKIEREINRLCKRREKICKSIQNIADDRLKMILQMKYISGLTIAEIADRVGYCPRQIQRLHTLAIEELDL